MMARRIGMLNTNIGRSSKGKGTAAGGDGQRGLLLLHLNARPVNVAASSIV
jgi:hypothetical protein